jgi:hypothetical protein
MGTISVDESSSGIIKATLNSATKSAEIYNILPFSYVLSSVGGQQASMVILRHKVFSIVLSNSTILLLTRICLSVPSIPNRIAVSEVERPITESRPASSKNGGNFRSHFAG